ncbi:hypothetical protein PV04_10395 [Phialophora macrospora]|uniref:Uncharacterized protein n=1 Tax=Phialophora macrospora TaxID=1851006 RepID=A0A0D2DIL1_9EURO|nr:hypothetical protein PV04_10395 [Phialophora macrospora]
MALRFQLTTCQVTCALSMHRLCPFVNLHCRRLPRVDNLSFAKRRVSEERLSRHIPWGTCTTAVRLDAKSRHGWRHNHLEWAPRHDPCDIGNAKTVSNGDWGDGKCCTRLVGMQAHEAIVTSSSRAGSFPRSSPAWMEVGS